MIDASTGEVTTQKMQLDRVWNLEKNKKIMVDLNGDGQGSDDGSNLLVRFLDKLCQKFVFCPISVERWDRMPHEKTKLQRHLREDEISENLPKDQELVASSSVPLKILAHPNDAIGKVHGAEHSSHVRG